MPGLSTNFINLIRDNLKDRYRTGFPIIKELIQNADDAGAKNLIFGYHNGVGVNNDGIVDHFLLKGPALWILNDGKFEETDRLAIHSFGLNAKAGNAGTIGKFGLGMKSVFHLCESFFYMAKVNNEIICHILNPRMNDWITKGIHKNWEEITELDKNYIKNTVLGDKKFSDNWFLLWIPLRTEKQVETIGSSIIARFPADNQAVDLDFFSDENSSKRISNVLPLLRNLETIQFVGVEGTKGFKINLKLNSPQNNYTRLNHSNEELQIQGEVKNSKDSENPLKFYAIQKVDNTNQFSEIRNLSSWPKTIAYSADGSEIEVKDKAEAESALMICHSKKSNKKGKIIIQWAVFLPVEEEGFSYKAEIDDLVFDYLIVLHSQFFVDSGRRGIAAIEALHDKKIKDAKILDTSQEAIIKHWNQALAQDLLLPEFLPTLAKFVKVEKLADEEVTRLTLAIKSCVSGSLAGVKFYDTFKEFICKKHSWVMQLTKEGVSWCLIDHSKTEGLLELPEPDSKQPQTPWDILGLENLNNYTFVVPKKPSLSKDISKWDVDSVCDLLRSLDVGVLKEPINLNYLIEFLKLVGNSVVYNNKVQSILVEKLRNFLTNEKLSDIRNDNFKNLLKHLKSDRIFGLGDSNYALSEDLYQVILAVKTNSLVVPKDLHPHNVNNDLESNDLHSWLSVINQYYINNDNVEPAQIINISKTIIKAAGNESEQADFVRKNCGQLKVLGVWNEKNDVDVLSLIDLKDANFEKRLFKIRNHENRLGYISSLSNALPNFSPILVDSAVAFYVQTVSPEIPFCDDANAIINCIGNSSQKLGIIDYRKVLLQELINQVDLNQPSIKKGIRYLLHNSLVNINDTQELWIQPQDDQNALWVKILGIIDNDNWKIIPREICEIIPHNIALVLNLKTVNETSVLDRLNALQNYNLIDAKEFTADEITNLLGRVTSRNVWRQLPLHLDVNGHYCHITDDSYCGNEPALPIGLNFDNIRFIVSSEDVYYRRIQDEWISKWNARTAAKYVLQSSNPCIYWEYLMNLLQDYPGQFNNLSNYWLQTSWLPLSNGSFIAIDKLIKLDSLTDKIKDFTRNCNYSWACPEDLHDEFRQHQSFNKINSLISTGANALPILGELMKEDKLFVGNIQISNLKELLPILVKLKNIPAWEYVKSAVEESSSYAVQKNLLPILSKDLTLEEYRDTLIALSKINNSDNEITIFNMYLIAWRNLKGATLVASNLVDLQLLSKAKNWVSAEQLVAGNLTGIDENSVLCNMHAEILKNVIVTNGANIANGRQENVDNNQNNQFNGSNIEKIVKYVEPLKNSDIKTAVGALIGLFGQGTRDIATEWLYPITYQSFINSIGWQDPGFNIINNTWNWMSRLTVEEALNSQKINLLIQNGGKINLISIIGMDVTVSSIPIDNISTLFLGSENYEENNVINIPLHPISVLDGKARNEKLKIIHETCKLLLIKIYNQNHANLNNFFSNLSTAEQISLDIARTLIIEGLPQMLRTLPGVNRNTILSNAIRNLDQQRRELASAKHNNLDTHNFTINLVNANEELANCLIDNYDVQKIILDAIRERVTHNQYEFSSIPFEIFQNADDAIVEMQNLQKNEERKEYKDIEIGRIVIKQNNYDKTIRKLKNDDNQIENRVIKVNKNINSINFAHWGRPINYAGSSANTFPEYCNDLERMLMLGASAKDAGENLTGKFGLGFKSLLLASTTPRVWSGDIAFEVVAGCLPEKLNASPNFIQFRNEIPSINQSSLRGTFIELPLDDGIEPTNVLDRFSSLAGLLPVFARCIVCVEVENDIHKWIPIDNQILALGESKIEIGEVFIPTKVGKTNTKLLVFRSNSGTIAMRIGASGFEKFDGNAKFPVPILWVTAPTRGTAARGVLMNGAFQIDTGRATLAQSQDSQKKNNEIAAKIASEIGPMLVELYSKKEWKDLRQFLGLNSEILASEFWYSLWDKLIGEKPSEDAATDVKLLDVFGSAVFKYFVEKTGKVPNGLGGFSHIKKIKLSLNHEYYKNIIPKIENWELFTKNFPKYSWCSKEVIGWLIRLEYLNNANIEEFGLRTVFKCFDDNLLKPLEIDSLASILKAWPQNTLVGNEQISNCFTNIKLQTQETNKSEPISSIIDTSSKDYKYLSLFAPDDKLIHSDYLNLEDAFSHIEKYFQYQTPSDKDVATWCIVAKTENQQKAVIKWLIRNLYGSIIDQIKEKCNNCWLKNLNDNSPILNNLSPAERGVLISKLSVPDNVKNGEVENPEDENLEEEPPIVPVFENNVTLDLIYQWWNDEGNEFEQNFDKRLWPEINIRERLNNDFDREAWMTLFTLGVFRRYGRVTDNQNRGFIKFLDDNGWWNTFWGVIPHDNNGRNQWIDILQNYAEIRPTETTFEMWMDSFHRIYRIARWLDEYALIFSRLDNLRNVDIAEHFLTPATNPIYNGSGIDAPTLIGVLRKGQHLVIRELLRANVLKSEQVKAYAFDPKSSVIKFLNQMGYLDLTTSQDIHNLMKKELGLNKSTFNGAYDIPLQLLATDNEAKKSFMAWAINNYEV